MCFFLLNEKSGTRPILIKILAYSFPYIEMYLKFWEFTTFHRRAVEILSFPGSKATELPLSCLFLHLHVSPD